MALLIKYQIEMEQILLQSKQMSVKGTEEAGRPKFP